jgi:hypothetical protein
VPTPAMWLKIRAKYKGGVRLVTTWNPNKGTGNQVAWPWGSTDPPLYATGWTVIGMPAWHKFDGEEKEALDRRNTADTMAHMTKGKSKYKRGNKRGQTEPSKL